MLSEQRCYLLVISHHLQRQNCEVVAEAAAPTSVVHAQTSNYHIIQLEIWAEPNVRLPSALSPIGKNLKCPFLLNPSTDLAEI